MQWGWGVCIGVCVGRVTHWLPEPVSESGYHLLIWGRTDGENNWGDQDF